MGQRSSFWLASARPGDERARLARDETCEVAVLGGGIAGVTIAYLLAREGADVVLLEAAAIGSGATGNTTAKVTSAHGLRYADLRGRHDPDTATAYASMNEGAIDLIDEIRAREDIDCAWRRRDAFTYTIDPARAGEIAAEVDAAREAGLSAEFVDTTPLPFPVAAAIRVTGQAEFHPVDWVRGLAGSAERHGARIFERTRAIEVGGGSRPAIGTDAGGRLRADRVVLATHFPTLDRGLFFALLSAQRSYCLGMRTAAPPPEGMFISADTPTRSVRAHPIGDGEELLIVGGEGHKAGQDERTNMRYAALESWAREHFDVTSIDYRWSAQDPMSPDKLPYVGALTRCSDRVLVATGFAKWGMTNGTAAAAILRDRIIGRENSSTAFVDSGRIDPRAAGPTIVRENVNVARHLFGDRLARLAGSPDALPAGAGAIVRSGGRRVAAYRDDGGALHALSPVCTHLGCEVRFNEAERSWDCPCHGSRFDAVDGSVIEGPAVHPLAHRRTANSSERGLEMSHDALNTYLNDHLAGATLGVDHARQLAERCEGTAFGPQMARVAAEIEQDRETLIEIMERLGTPRNSLKAATAWVAEKAGRVKFSGLTSGDAELGNFLALETMSLGVEGKRSLWTTLQTVAPYHPALATLDLEELVKRAESQRATLEDERATAAVRAFAEPAAVATTTH